MYVLEEHSYRRIYRVPQNKIYIIASKFIMDLNTHGVTDIATDYIPSDFLMLKLGINGKRKTI